jgi:hypothetical protein
MPGNTSHARKLTIHLDCPVEAACMVRFQRVRNCWLAVSPFWFSLVKRGGLLGKPVGKPFAELLFADVASVALWSTVATMRATVALHDGREFAFETHRRGPDRPNPEVLDLFAQRCIEVNLRPRAMPGG